MSAQAGLAGRALRGLSWNYLGTVGRIVATFASQIVLARLLGPEPFGLFGYAFLTMTFIALVVEMGMQQALIQVPNLAKEVVATACGRLLFVGAVAALGVYLLADLIAVHVFSAPQAAIIIRAMAPTLVVGAATAAATAVLSRDIEFKVIQLAGLGSYVLGYLLVGVAAALLGMGVWSLVLAWHVQTVTACLAMIYFSPRPLTPGNPFHRLEIAKFGVVVMYTNMVNWVIDSGAHVAIGRWLGPTQLGQYTVANNLVRVPADHLVRNVQSVLFPLAARAQDNDAGLRRAYLTVVGGVGVLSFPIFTFAAVMSQPIVLLLLGPKWAVAAQVLTPLSLAMIGHAVEALCGPILGGRGEPHVELRVKIVTLVVMLAVLAVTASWSLAAIGWGVALVYLFRWVWMSAAVMTRLDISGRNMAQALLGSVVLAGICYLAAAGVGLALEAFSASPAPLIQLSITALLTIVLSMLAVVFAPWIILGPHLLALLDQLLKQRPSMAGFPGLSRIALVAAKTGR